MTTPVRADQINLTGYTVNLDREVEVGTGRINVYDEDDNLVASIPATDKSIIVS